MSYQIKRQLIRTAVFLAAKAGLSQILMLAASRVPARLLETIRQDAPFPYPQEVQFEITMRCNLNCRMCHQKKRREDGVEDLSKEEILHIIDAIDTGSLRRLKLIGGEVFVRHDILNILQQLEHRRISVSITTNGTLLNDTLLTELRRLDNLSGMVFSLDGMESRHNQIRGLAGGFARTVSGLRAVSEFLPLTRVTCVLQNDNLEDIADLIRHGREWGASIISLMLESFFLAEDLAATRQRLGELGEVKFLVSPSASASYGFSLEHFRTAMADISRLARSLGMIAHVAPPVAALYPEDFYQGTILRHRGRMSCGYLQRLTITESGDVLACPFIDLRFGNLLTQSLDNIWRSEAFNRYRQLFVQQGPWPICRRCCVLAPTSN